MRRRLTRWAHATARAARGVALRPLHRLQRPRLGIGVALTEVRAVLTHRDVVAWAGAAMLPAGGSLCAAIGELLAAIPPRRGLRPIVAAAVGPGAAQVKCLAGLPPLADAHVLEALIRENAGRFFLRNGIPLRTTGVRPVSEGRAWAAALDVPGVAAIEQACADHRLRLRAAVPAVVALAHATRSPRVRWVDGTVAAEVTFDGGRLTTVRRVARTSAADDGEGNSETPVPVPALAALGERAWRFADAFGATYVTDGEPLAVRPRHHRARPPVPPRRLALGALGFAVGLCFALLAPALVSGIAVRRAERRLAALAPRRAAAVREERALATASGALEELERFGAERRSATLFLATLTESLGASTALLSLRTDSSGGTVVALADRGAAVLAQLEHVPGTASPTIEGPITSEVVAGRSRERVTIRFRWSGSARGRSAPPRRSTP